MIPDYGEKIYDLLSGLIGLKFKSQIKDSGIQFKRIFKVVDLETNVEYYSLFLDDKRINFKNKTEFIKQFVEFLEKNLDELDKRFEELQTASNGRWVDENQLYMEHEELGHYSSKQSKLLKKIQELK